MRFHNKAITRLNTFFKEMLPQPHENGPYHVSGVYLNSKINFYNGLNNPFALRGFSQKKPVEVSYDGV